MWKVSIPSLRAWALIWSAAALAQIELLDAVGDHDVLQHGDPAEIADPAALFARRLFSPVFSSTIGSPLRYRTFVSGGRPTWASSLGLGRNASLQFEQQPDQLLAEEFSMLSATALGSPESSVSLTKDEAQSLAVISVISDTLSVMEK